LKYFITKFFAPLSFTCLAILFLSTVLFTCSTQAQNSTSITSISVEVNNVSGGGFQSDVTISDDGQTVYSSADVSGIFKSTNGGELFENVNQGLKSQKVASLAITHDNPQILYAGTGDKGGSGGLYRSTDGGDTWQLTLAGDSAQFAGNHSKKSDPIADKHPRSNGDLIVVVCGDDSSTHTDDIVIAGSYNKGIRIFTNGGDVEASALKQSGFVRSVAYDTSLGNRAYAAIQFSDTSKNGIYKFNFTDPVNPTVYLHGDFLRPEGLTVLSNGNVYAAIGTQGIAKYDGTNWQIVSDDLDTGNPNRVWTAVTGYVLNGNDVVYAGTNNQGGNQNGTAYSNIWRTVNGGNDWNDLVLSNNVSEQIYGQSYIWWFTDKAFPQAILRGKNSVVSSIDVSVGTDLANVSDDIIYVSGRGGIWKSENGGGLWQPAVFNMQATANNGVAINPNNSNQIAIANTDFVVLETSEKFENDKISRDKPNQAESKGYDIIFDERAYELILGVGDRDTNFPGGGEVYRKKAAFVGNPSDSGWDNLGLSAVTGNNNGRVRAVTYGYHKGDDTTSQTILAAVENEGMFRYHNDNWQPSVGAAIDTTDRCNLIWPDNRNSGDVYLLDISTGLYRSENGGQNWVNIWPDMNFKNNDFYNTGYIAADDNNPTTLYISMQGDNNPYIGTSHKVYRLERADSVIYGNPNNDPFITDITFHSGIEQIKRPGPMVFGQDGNLWLTQQQYSPNSIDAALFVMENPEDDDYFIDVSANSNAYKNLVTSPSGIDVSNDGYIYISQTGTGLAKIKYSDEPNIGLSNSCIEVYPDPTTNIYTISGVLAEYNIEIIDANGNVYDTVDNTGTKIGVDVSNLPAGTFLVRVSDPSNNQMCVQKILKF